MITDNPLDVKEMFGRTVPEYSKRAEPTVELPSVPKPDAKPTDTRDYKGGLVAAAGKGMYALLPSGKKLLFAKEHTDNVVALTEHHDVLLHAGEFGIRETLSGHVVFSPKGGVTAMMSSGYHLYYANLYSIHRTDKMSRIPSDLNALPASKYVSALAILDDVLYRGGPDGIYDARTGELKNQRSTWSLCATKEAIWAGVEKGKRDKPAVINALTDAVIAERPGFPQALCMCGDSMYDGGNYGVCETFRDVTEARPLWKFDDAVRALTSVGEITWDKIMKVGTMAGPQEYKPEEPEGSK